MKNLEKRILVHKSIYEKLTTLKRILMQSYNIILKDNGYNKEARDLNKLYAQKRSELFAYAK